MKAKESGNGVKVANQRVVEEMLNFINTPGSFKEKSKAIWNIQTDRRPGKELAEKFRSDYLHKFDWYTKRSILGTTPRGIEQYGHKVRKEEWSLNGVVLVSKGTWEHRFVDHLKSLYSVIDYTLIPALYPYDFSGKRDQANSIRAEHIARIEALKPKSNEIIAEREYFRAKAKATVHNSELTSYLELNFPYRQAQGKWAGGETSIDVFTRHGYACEGIGTSQRVWSDNGKWSGLNADYRFYVQDDETLIVIGGLVTVYKKSDERLIVKPCTWWEQSRGFELVQKTGFLVGGYHSEAKTKEAAIKGAKQSKNYNLSKDDFVLTIEYVAKKFGFCQAGIRNFMAQNEITADRITVGELRNIVVKNREINCRSYRNHLMKMGIVLNCK